MASSSSSHALYRARTPPSPRTHMPWGAQAVPAMRSTTDLTSASACPPPPFGIPPTPPLRVDLSTRSHSLPCRPYTAPHLPFREPVQVPCPMRGRGVIPPKAALLNTNLDVVQPDPARLSVYRFEDAPEDLESTGDVEHIVDAEEAEAELIDALTTPLRASPGTRSAETHFPSEPATPLSPTPAPYTPTPTSLSTLPAALPESPEVSAPHRPALERQSDRYTECPRRVAPKIAQRRLSRKLPPNLTTSLENIAALHRELEKQHDKDRRASTATLSTIASFGSMGVSPRDSFHFSTSPTGSSFPAGAATTPARFTGPRGSAGSLFSPSYSLAAPLGAVPEHASLPRPERDWAPLPSPTRPPALRTASVSAASAGSARSSTSSTVSSWDRAHPHPPALLFSRSMPHVPLNRPRRPTDLDPLPQPRPMARGSSSSSGSESSEGPTTPITPLNHMPVPQIAFMAVDPADRQKRNTSQSHDSTSSGCTGGKRPYGSLASLASTSVLRLFRRGSKPATDEPPPSSGSVSTSALHTLTSASRTKADPAPAACADPKSWEAKAHALPDVGVLLDVSEFPVMGEDGVPVRFGELVARRTIVVFVRHWLSPQCGAYVRSLIETFTPSVLARARARLVIVGHGPAAHITAFKRHFECPFPVFTDPKRRVHAALGLLPRPVARGSAAQGPYVSAAGSMSCASLSSPPPPQGFKGATRRAASTLLCAARLHAFRAGSTAGLGGAFVFDGSLCVRFAHRMAGADDHAPICELLDAVNAAAAPPVWSPGASRVDLHAAPHALHALANTSRVDLHAPATQSRVDLHAPPHPLNSLASKSRADLHAPPPAPAPPLPLTRERSSSVGAASSRPFLRYPAASCSVASLALPTPPPTGPLPLPPRAKSALGAAPLAPMSMPVPCPLGAAPAAPLPPPASPAPRPSTDASEFPFPLPPARKLSGQPLDDAPETVKDDTIHAYWPCPKEAQREAQRQPLAGVALWPCPNMKDSRTKHADHVDAVTHELCVGVAA